MNTKIQESLLGLFKTTRFVFWHDPEHEFVDEIDQLQLPQVQVLRTDQQPALDIKLKVVRSAPDSKWLFYSEVAVPEIEHDWLLDLRVRGQPFYADTTSILLAELGLHNLALREHLKRRSRFLASKSRVSRLKNLVLPDDDEAALDRKIIASLVRADQPDFASILLKLFTGLEVNGEVTLDQPPAGWADIVSYDLESAFWQLVMQETGYSDTTPCLRDLLFRMLITDLARGCQTGLPASLSHFILPDPVKSASISVFLSHWRSSIAHFASYNAITTEVSRVMQLANLLAPLHAEDLQEAHTFAEVEKVIIKDLRDRILSAGGAAKETVSQMVMRRRDGHWANPKLAASSEEIRGLLACHTALEAAAEFLQLKAAYPDGFTFADAQQAISSYRQQLYRFDQTYRHFHHASAQVEPLGWSLLHSLRDSIESLYAGWFIPQLAIAWGKVLEGGQGLLSQWQVPGMVNQQRFFQREVTPLLEGTHKRVFVIISDALRYEVAEELARLQASRNRFKSSLDAMLGVLPSYTTLGMAALLPHKTLAYRTNSNLDITVDDQPCATTEQRNTVLAAHGGMAIKWDELIALGKQAGRERVRDANIVYIYHDRIDMLGDKAASESKTFEAVDDTLRELNELIGFLINSLNASTVLVTADHGFVYQESALDVVDKSTIEVKPSGILKSKKRYILGQELGDTDKAWYGNTAQTAGTQPQASLDFWIPKGATRFHFAGGARFVHGSAMPQEIVVPLLTVKVSDANSARTDKVGIVPLMSDQRIVNNVQSLNFIQTEAVSDKMHARTVSISLRDGEALISNEQVVTFDSPSDDHNERKKSVLLIIQGGSYDRNKDFHIVVRDVADKIEVLRIAVKIDLALANDF